MTDTASNGSTRLRGPTPGSWKKGQSGNPLGASVTKRRQRSEVVQRTAKQQAEKHARKAFKFLVGCMQNDEAPMASRVSAAAQILDRAYGKAPQDVNVRGSVEHHIISLLKAIDNQGDSAAPVLEHESSPGAEQPTPTDRQDST